MAGPGRPCSGLGTGSHVAAAWLGGPAAAGGARWGWRGQAACRVQSTSHHHDALHSCLPTATLHASRGTNQVSA